MNCFFAVNFFFASRSDCSESAQSYADSAQNRTPARAIQKQGQITNFKTELSRDFPVIFLEKRFILQCLSVETIVSHDWGQQL